MPIIARRQFLVGTALSLLTSSVGAGTAPAEDVVQDRTVQLRSDGLSLSPADYVRLLTRLAQEPGIEADDYSRHGVVARPEERMAALLGKETAVYLPTGTLANHLAVRDFSPAMAAACWCSRRAICITTRAIAPKSSAASRWFRLRPEGHIALADVETEIWRAESARVRAPIAAISIELPVRRAVGEVFEFAEMQKIAAFARERGIGLHLDGARLFLTSTYTGILPARYAALFDTVYVSLYKYLNPTSGAILAGPRPLLENLYRDRRMFGGGLAQVWPDANRHRRCRVVRRPMGTNVARLHVTGANAASLPSACAHTRSRSGRTTVLSGRSRVHPVRQRDDCGGQRYRSLKRSRKRLGKLGQPRIG